MKKQVKKINLTTIINKERETSKLTSQGLKKPLLTLDKSTSLLLHTLRVGVNLYIQDL